MFIVFGFGCWCDFLYASLINFLGPPVVAIVINMSCWATSTSVQGLLIERKTLELSQFQLYRCGSTQVSRFRRNNANPKVSFFAFIEIKVSSAILDVYVEPYIHNMFLFVLFSYLILLMPFHHQFTLILYGLCPSSPSPRWMGPSEQRLPGCHPGLPGRRRGYPHGLILSLMSPHGPAISPQR